jgi:uncharacterized membrane protein
MDEHTRHSWIEARKTAGRRNPAKKDSFNQRLAVFITHIFGSMWMFYALVCWMFGWMALATAGVVFFRNDPYPFTFLLFLSNLVQLFALPILAVGQRVLSRATEEQDEQTYKDAEAILELQDETHRLIMINNRLTEQIHALVQKEK